MNRKLTVSVCLCLALCCCALLLAPGQAQARKKPSYILADLPWELDQQAVMASLGRRHWQKAQVSLGPMAGMFLTLSFVCCPLVPEEVSDMVTTLGITNFRRCQRVEASNGKGMKLGMVFSQATGKILCYEFSDKDIKGLAAYIKGEFRSCKTAACQGSTNGRPNQMPYCRTGDIVLLVPQPGKTVMAVYLGNIAAHLKATGIKPSKTPLPPC